MAATLLRSAPRRGVAAVRRTSRTCRHFRLRKKISGTPVRPRLAVTRSARHIYAQVVDDLAGRTLASASTLDSSIRGSADDKTTRARRVGELLASRAKDAGVTTVVFDRGGNSYHGRIAALADAARKGGLEF